MIDMILSEEFLETFLPSFINIYIAIKNVRGLQLQIDKANG